MQFFRKTDFTKASRRSVTGLDARLKHDIGLSEGPFDRPARAYHLLSRLGG